MLKWFRRAVCLGALLWGLGAAVVVLGAPEVPSGDRPLEVANAAPSALLWHRFYGCPTKWQAAVLRGALDRDTSSYALSVEVWPNVSGRWRVTGVRLSARVLSRWSELEAAHATEEDRRLLIRRARCPAEATGYRLTYLFADGRQASVEVPRLVAESRVGRLHDRLSLLPLFRFLPEVQAP